MYNKIIKNIIKGTSATTLGTIASMVFHFISIFFLTRYLTVTDFGVYALIIVISGLLNLFSGLGLEISIVKFISEGVEFRNTILRPALTLKTFATVLISLLYLSIYKLYPTGGEDRVWEYNLFILIIFIIGSYRDFFYRVIQGLNKFLLYASVQISSAVTRVILIVIFIYFYELTLLDLLYIEIAAILIAVLLQYIFIPFRELIKESSEHKQYRQLIKFSLPLFANNLITFAYDKVGIFVIGIMMSTASVAIYDVATRIPGAFMGIFSSFILVFFPNISSLFLTSDKINAEKLINNSLNIISLILGFFSLVVFLWRDLLVEIFFSVNYLESSLPLALLMISLILRLQANILGYSIVSAGYSKIPLKVNLVSVFVGISSNLLLVWKFGYLGAVISAIILNLVSFIQYNFYVKKLSLVKIQNEYVIPILTYLLISGLIYFINVYSFYLNILALILFLGINFKSLINFNKLLILGKIKTVNSK